jgi:hypothetical protein
VYKISFLLQQNSGQNRIAGFSETWYRDGTLPEVVTAADAVAKRRSGFLTGFAAITGTRIQLIGGGAQVQNGQYVGTYRVNQDIPQMALNCICKGQGVLNKKTFQLRGIPDGNVEGGEFNPTQQFSNNFDTWARSLVSEGMRFKAKDMTQPKVQIVSIANDGTFQLAAPITFNVGSYIDLLRVRTTTGLLVSGTYYVSVKTDGANGKFLNWPGGTVTLNGQARTNVTIYPLVDRDTVRYLKITTRKVGRPFDLYAGRRRTRSRRRA